MNPLSRIRRWLVAPATVLPLIVALALGCLAGLLVPQTIFRGEEYYLQLEASRPWLAWLITFLGLDRIYSTWWFLILVGLFALSLLCTVWDQVQRRMRTGVTRLEPRAGYQQVASLIEGSPIEEFSRLRTLLRGLGFRLAAEAEQKPQRLAVFRRGQLGRWGMPVFHLGVLLVILAALYGLAFHNRNFVQVMEGETISGNPEEWLISTRGALARPLKLDTAFRLDRFEATYWPTHRNRSVTSHLTFLNPQGEEQPATVSVSYPLTRSGVTWYQSTDFGYAVTLVMEQPQAEPVYTHFLLDRTGHPAVPQSGSSDFPGTPYLFELKLYPDPDRQSFALGTTPVVALTIHEDHEVRFEERIPLGMGFVLEDREFYFVDVRPWSGFFVVTGYAIPLLYLGFSVALAGLFLHYGVVSRTLYVRLDEQRRELALAWSGSGRDLPGSEEELAAIAGEMKRIGSPSSRHS